MNSSAAQGASNKPGAGSGASPAQPPSREDLRRKIERQQREIEKLREQVVERDQQIAEQQGQIAEQQGQITELERQLAMRKRNSTTSSKPPSSDGLAGKQRTRCSQRKKSVRKPGGQPGHTGHERPLVENPDRIEEVLPQQCKHCAAALPQGPEARRTDGDMFRRQVVDLPAVILPVVTEYQYPKVVCPCCQKATRAELRPEDAQGIGPLLTASIAYLIAVRKMTRRDVQATLQEVLNVEISLGSVQKAWEETADAVEAPCAELVEALPSEPVVNSDETGSRTNGEKRWVWALCTPLFVVYHIARSRGVAVLEQLLGEVFAGILCSDRCPTYLSYHQGLAQFCWAHLQRTLKGIGEGAATADAVHFARDMLSAIDGMFALWYRFRGEAGSAERLLSRKELIEQSIPIQKKICALARRFLDSDDREVRNLAHAFYEHWDKLFTFLAHEGVEPTNNFAERILRLFVLIRKITYGNRSATGAHRLGPPADRDPDLQIAAALPARLFTQSGLQSPPRPPRTQPPPPSKSTIIG